MGSSSERSSAPESQLISRRTLVRAGATAAWTVPLVQVIGAAPASAVCSGSAPTLSFNSASASWQDPTHVRVKVDVANSSVTVNASALTVTVGIPATVASSQTIKPTGWNAAAISGNTLTFLAEAPVTHGSSLGFYVLVQVAGGSQGGSVPIGASATCASSITWASSHPDIVLGAAPAQSVAADLVLDAQTLTIVRNPNDKDVTITANVKNNAPAGTGRSSGTLTFSVDVSAGSRGTLVPVVTAEPGSSAGWVSPGVWTPATKTASTTGTSIAPQVTSKIVLKIDYGTKTGASTTPFDFVIKASCVDGDSDTVTKKGNG